MPDLSTARDFLNTLNHAHSAIEFTMEVENDGMLPFFGIQLLNRAPRIETKVFVKPTNSSLLLHYHSHVDNRYKRGLLTTTLDRAYRLSSSWSYFTEECERLKSVFSKLKYPKHLVDSTVKTFLNLKVADQPSSRSRSTTENTTRVVIPFKDQESANIVKTQFNRCLRAARLPRSSRQTNLSLSSLINNALCIVSSVTSAMLVMSDTPVAICSYAQTL